MGKRPGPCRLRSARAYTVPEFAKALGVSTGTVRGYVRSGMPVMQQKRPLLILGEHAKDFLAKRQIKAKRPLEPNQLYCMACKAPRRPGLGMVDLIQTPGQTARIMGFCEVCETTCCRAVGKPQIARLGEFFDVTT